MTNITVDYSFLYNGNYEQGQKELIVKDGVLHVDAGKGKTRKALLLSRPTANPKLTKGQKKGYITAGLQLMPSTGVEGIDTCPTASPGCAASCLNLSGRGAMWIAQNGRSWKTALLFHHKDVFIRALFKEVERFIKYAEKRSMIPAIRLNVTSDIVWESRKYRHPETGQTIMDAFPELIFYDYTAISARMGKTPANYHLTFSRKETAANHTEVETVMAAGHNVSAVFVELPETWNGVKVIDGDETDLRFLDSEDAGGQVVVGLVPKGSNAKKDTSGFIIR